jgi:hypothetical protein
MPSNRWLVTSAATLFLLLAGGVSTGYGSCGDWLAGHKSSPATTLDEPPMSGAGEVPRADSIVLSHGGSQKPCHGFLCGGGDDPSPEPQGVQPSSEQAGAGTTAPHGSGFDPASFGYVLDSPFVLVAGVLRRIDRPPQG